MDAMWMQMAIGVLGSMVLGIVTNLMTPVARRAFRWCARRGKGAVRMISRVTPLHRLRRRAGAPIRRLAAALRV